MEGLRQRLWLVLPPGRGPFPVLVWNHGAQVMLTPQGEVIDRSTRPQIHGNAADQRRWAEQLGCLLLIPEGRGYGGSEGPKLASVLHDAGATLEYLAARARDANAAARWGAGHPAADATRIAIAGASHGSVVALLAAAQQDYAGTAALATAVWPRRADIGVTELGLAAAWGHGPLLLQHMLSDRSAPAEFSRMLFLAANSAGRPATLREYPGLASLDGHQVFAAANRQQWEGDFLAFIARCCRSPVAAAAV